MPTVKKAPAKKTTSKKALVEKPAAKKATTKPAKKAPETEANGPTVREQVFKLLLGSSDGLTGGEIKELLDLKTVPMCLKDEGVCEVPRIKRVKIEGVRGVKYLLTPVGKKAVQKNTVDSEAAASSSGEVWPDGR